MKYIGLGIVVLGLLSGCSTTEKELSDSSEVNETVQYEVGQAATAIGNAKLTLKPLDGYEQVVTINFDKTPYHKTFDLCENTKIYDLKDSVTSDPDNMAKNSLENKKVSCKSWFKAKPIGNNKFYVYYNVKVLNGYETQDSNGHENYLPQIQEFKMIPTVFYSGDVIEVMNVSADGKVLEPLMLELNL